MAITADNIIFHLTKHLEPHDFVLACWLEGSMGQGTDDRYSDIDLVLNVKDGKETATLNLVAKILEELTPLDYRSEITRPNRHIWYQVFHVKGASKFLVIDVNVECNSRQFKFTQEMTHEKPLVLFDKANVIQFKKLDQKAFVKDLETAIKKAKSDRGQAFHVEKYLKRGQFLEAFIAYQKFILQPLIVLLRTQYSPLKYDYYLVQASKDFPASVLKKLETLHQCKDLKDLEKKAGRATRWLDEIITVMPKKILS